MKFTKLKFITAGFLLGVILSTSVTAFGLIFSSGKIEAWLQDKQVRVIVDGDYVDLPEDMHIINYEDRIYTPARFVAEQLGAEVIWEEARQAIIITPPEPVYVEVEREVIIEDTLTEREKYNYSPLPIRRIQRDVSISLTRMSHYNSESHVIFDFINKNQFPVMFLKNQTYIEYDGEKHPVIAEFTVNGANTNLHLFDNTTNAGYEDDDIVFKFPRVPDDVTGIKLNIALEVYDSPFDYSDNRIVNFEFYIDPTEEDYFDW